MIDLNAINKTLRDAIVSIIDDPNYVVIKAKQTDATRPTVPYADVDYLSGLPIGWEEVTNEGDVQNENTIQDIAGMREITFSLGFYKDNAENNAQKVYTGLIRESIQALFASNGIGLALRSEVRELTLSLDTAWEERAGFDVTVNTISEDTDTTFAILSANVTSEYQ